MSSKPSTNEPIGVRIFHQKQEIAGGCAIYCLNNTVGATWWTLDDFIRASKACGMNRTSWFGDREITYLLDNKADTLDYRAFGRHMVEKSDIECYQTENLLGYIVNTGHHWVSIEFDQSDATFMLADSLKPSLVPIHGFDALFNILRDERLCGGESRYVVWRHSDGWIDSLRHRSKRRRKSRQAS